MFKLLKQLSGVFIAFLGLTTLASAQGLITIIVNNPVNPYWYIEGQVAAKTAQAMGYESEILAHGSSVDIEKTHIEAAIHRNAVGIVLDPADTEKSIPAIEAAANAGIPVILVNAQIKRDGLVIAQLFSNNKQGALLGATHWATLMENQGDYFELTGSPADINASIRSDSYDDVLSQYAGLQKIDRQIAHWDRQQGYEKTKAFIQQNPSVKGIIAGNDEMALGAIQALEEAGLSNVIVGGFDGSPEAIEAIHAGQLAYTILQPVAIFAEASVRQLHSYLKRGKTGAFTERQSFDCFLITADNARKYTAPFLFKL